MIYVLSDIHGNSHNFNSILRQIKLQATDTLYVLGDVVDRHPDGIKLLRRIMAMPNAKMLLGNHEYMMMQALKPSEFTLNPWEQHFFDRNIQLWYRNGGAITHHYWKHNRKAVRQEIMDYLSSLPFNINIEVGDKKYKLVHGSPLENYPGSYRYSTKAQFAVWERWMPHDPVPEGYTLIFGHTPTISFQNDNPLSVWFSDNAIGIDCGSGFPINDNRYLEKGRLACLRLDDLKVFYSEEVIQNE